MAYTASNILGANSPAVGASKATYTAAFDTAFQKIDEHDHSAGKGTQIPTGGLADLSVTTGKVADLAITAAKIAATTITAAKLAAAVAAALVPAGTILSYGGTSAPTGYLLCNGDAVSRTTYADLFAVVGEAFGEGDNATTFNVPDLRGRFLRGLTTDTARDPDYASRTAMATGGGAAGNIGSIQGDAFAAHTHTESYMAGITPGPSGSGSNYGTSSANQASGSAGSSTETRPKNAFVNFIIKT